MHVVQEEQAGWYEASLSLQERRKRGHFSTPPLLVERILDACGYTPGSDLGSLRVLDPACGSGNFLAAAARRLVTYASNSSLPRQELAAIVQHNLWGFDPDPVSCFLAEMQLSATLAAEMARVDGEALAVTSAAFHIHQADGLALPWQEPCVDFYVANPPYLAAKNTDLSAYRSPHQRGQADSYLLFLSLGLRIVRPGGWLGLVLPDPLLARTNASRERTRLLEEFTLHHLWHLSNVFTAQVGAIVIIAQKKPATMQHYVVWKREKWQHSPRNAKESGDDGEGGNEVECRSQDEDEGKGQGQDDCKGQGEDEGKGQGQDKGKGRSEDDGEGQSQDDCKGQGEDDHKGQSQDDRKGHPYYTLRGEPCGKLMVRTVLQSLFLRQPRAEFRYLLSNEYGPTIERLQAHMNNAPGSSCGFTPLSHFLTISRGEELGMKSPYLSHEKTVYSRGDPCGRPGMGPYIQLPANVQSPSNLNLPTNVQMSMELWSPSNMDNDHKSHTAAAQGLSPMPQTSPSNMDNDHKSHAWYPVLRGGKDLRPYQTPHNAWWIAREAISKPLERYLSPKLLVVKSTNRLQATLDVQGHVALQTLYLLHLRVRDACVDESEDDHKGGCYYGEGQDDDKGGCYYGEGQDDRKGKGRPYYTDDLYFYLALLNSRLLRQYVYVLHTAYKWVQPQIEQHVLARIPVPIVTAREKQEVIARAKLLMQACSAPGTVVEWNEDMQNIYEEQERALSALYNALMC